MTRLRFYSKSDCSLCDAGLLLVERIARRRGLVVEKIDIERDDALRAQYGERIPVVEWDGREIASGRLSERDTARILDRLLAHGAAGGAGAPDPQPAADSRGPLRRFLEAEHTAAPLVAWSTAAGAAVGLLGGAFRWTVDHAVTERASLVAAVAAVTALPAWLVSALASALMVFAAVWLVRRFAPETAGSGVQEIEGALDGVRPLRWRRVLPVKFAGGVLALGAGMVVGREGPTIQMGGNVGKMAGDLFGLGAEKTHVLVAACAGAGLAAAFNAPLAGLLFVIEEMRPQFHYSAISALAVLVACAVSDVVVRLMLGGAPIISMPLLPVPALSAMWIFIVFGALVGAIGPLFNRALLTTLDRFQALGPAAFIAAGAAVGALVGALAWSLPTVGGGGYLVVTRTLAAPVSFATLGFLFVARFALTLICFAAGAPGGIFAPLVALGTLFGIGFGHLWEHATPQFGVHPDVFAVAGMGALFAATVRAPVTGIMLALEMTGNYEQTLPLMLTCVAATLVAHRLGGEPIYTLLLKRSLAKQEG